MKNKYKKLLISVAFAFAVTPLAAAGHGHAGSPLEPQANVYKPSCTKLKIGRDLQQGAASTCVKWKKHCYTKRYCHRYFKNPCFMCRVYHGSGNYTHRKTCSAVALQTYRKQGFWCYQYQPYTGKCSYYYKTFCSDYCYKTVYK